MRPPPFGAEINDPVGLFDDVEIVFDDQDGVAERDEVDGERVAGYFQMNIFQVVLPGAPDNL